MTNDDLLFLARFARTPDGQALLRILEAKLASVMETLLKADGNDAYRYQGRARQIQELRDDIAGAEASLARLAPAARRTR